MQNFIGTSTPLSERCAEEPIHIIGMIQGYGLLFALSEPDLIMRQVSANVSTLLGVSPEILLGQSFEAVQGEQFETFRALAMNRLTLPSECVSFNRLVVRMIPVVVVAVGMWESALSISRVCGKGGKQCHRFPGFP
jgi:light-regulated signal transduction histidine kinase (bacteriophytochrome)